MIIKKLFFVIALAIWGSVAFAQVFQIQGHYYSGCGDAQNLGNAPMDSFSNWSNGDFENLKEYINQRCTSMLSSDQGLISNINNAQDRITSEKAKQESFRLNKQKKIEECQNFSAFTTYMSEQNVISTNQSLQFWYGQKQKQREIEKESGVINLTTARNAGEMIVRTKDQLNQAFQTYKNLGGKAKTPDAVKLTAPNPCPR